MVMSCLALFAVGASALNVAPRLGGATCMRRSRAMTMYENDMPLRSFLLQGAPALCVCPCTLCHMLHARVGHLAHS